MTLNSKKIKKGILLFIKVPPPLTGATLINQYVNNSNLIHNKYNIRTIPIRYVNKLKDMSKVNMKKINIFIRTLIILFKELWNYKPELIYFQISIHGNAFIRDLIYVIIMKLFKVKIVFHLHGKGISEKTAFIKKFYRLCFKNEYIICLSSLLIYDIKSVYSGEPYIVPNGIPDIVGKKVDTNIVEFPIKLLFLSNLIVNKGIYDFIESLKILNENKIEFKAKIVGEEAEINKKQITSILKQNNLQESCIYLGPKYKREKEELINESDILIFPTRDDTFGIIIIEAMMHSKPVISTNIGSIPEIIDDSVTGFIVENKSPQQIVERIKLLIKDPNQIIKMGKAGREKFIRNYTIEKFEEKLCKVFDDIIVQEKEKWGKKSY